jgi:hypothetical protein
MRTGNRTRHRSTSKPKAARERSIQPAEVREAATFEDIADLVGSVDGLPPDLSANTKRYLRETGYGRKRHG